MSTKPQIAPFPLASRALHSLRVVLGVFKLRIGVLITITALVGSVVTPGAPLTAMQLLALALSVLIASAGAGAFNQYFEYESDRAMTRTRTRAFATGALPRTWAWPILIGVLALLGVTLAAYALNTAAALYVFLGAFFYAVVYTVWLKRRTAWNIVIGGLAGSFAVLSGAAAVDPTPGIVPWLFALVLFLWTPPHFWSLAIAYEADYAAARVPMLPLVVGAKRAAQVVFGSTLALGAASALPAFFGLGSVYLIGSLAASAYFVHSTARLAREPHRKNAMRSFHASLVHLSALLIAACLDVLLIR